MRLAHPAVAIALVASLALAGCSSGDSSDASADAPASSGTTSAPASPPTSAGSEAPATDGSVAVVTLLSRNLEAYKKASGTYPKPGSTAYQQVVGIDQADGYTLGYAVDGSGVMTICASSDDMSASYDSQSRDIAEGKGTCGS